MHRQLLVTILLVVVSPVSVSADTARSVLEMARAKQIERWEGVESYVVHQSSAGSRSTIHYRRVEAEGPDGKPFLMFQPAPAQAGAGGAAGQSLSPQDLEVFAQGMERTGAAQARGIEDGLEEAGLPRGLLAATGSDPAATFDPRVTMGANAQFVRGAARAQEVNAAERARDQQEAASQMAEFIEKARLVGTEDVHGRKAFHLRAEDLKHSQQDGGEEFTLNAVSLWIDSGEYVPLRTKLEGVATSQGKSRPITIERLDSDYRVVPGSSMYEPYRQVVRFAGVMSPAQQQELREAQAKMADFERQLAGMPEGQRRMIMNQMGPQLAMMKSMAAGGGVEMVTEVHEIIVNP